MMAAAKSYAGSCHCGQVKYSFSLSPPIEEQEVVQCNCSICRINGYLLVYPKIDDFEFPKEDTVKAYRFASEQVPHYFCTNCGTSLYARSTIPHLSHIVALNVRTIPDVEIESLKIKKMDGKSIKFEKQG